MLVNISRGEWGNRETGFHRVEGGVYLAKREVVCTAEKGVDGWREGGKGDGEKRERSCAE